jgi:hypothetical protein
MGHRSRVILVGLGFTAGLSCGALWGCGAATPAHDRPLKESVTGHYHVAAWGGASGHGAYIVDTQTGEVYAVVENHKPERVGKAGDQ